MKILLVGQGDWSRKIKGALDQLPRLLSVKSISARECMHQSGRLRKVSSEYDVVWICTRPEWQLDVLEELIDFPGHTIIEKPYLNDKKSFERLVNFLDLIPGRLQLSEPWTHTNIWHETKKLLAINSNESIQIQRGGTTGHEYINEVLDWLPHDVNLLFDLFGAELLNAQFSNIVWSNGIREVRFNLNIPKTREISFRIGRFEEGRLASWDSGKIKIDFNESYILSERVKIRINELTNPFITQLKAGPTTHLGRLEQQLQVHELFRQHLFN